MVGSEAERRPIISTIPPGTADALQAALTGQRRDQARRSAGPRRRPHSQVKQQKACGGEHWAQGALAGPQEQTAQHAVVERDIKCKRRINRETGQVLLVLWNGPMLAHQ